MIHHVTLLTWIYEYVWGRFEAECHCVNLLTCVYEYVWGTFEEYGEYAKQSNRDLACKFNAMNLTEVSELKA